MRALIREAKPAEAGSLSEVALAAKSHWDYPAEWLDLWRDSLTIDPRFVADSPVWVAEVDGRVVGFIALALSAHYAEIEHLWVLPDSMGQGLGAQLLAVARGFCRQHRFSSLRIESDPNAQAFYEKMGAKLVGSVESLPPPRRLPVLLLQP